MDRHSPPDTPDMPAMQMTRAQQRARIQQQSAYRAARQQGPVASIIIPAHNEEAVIGRCLSTITAGMRPGEFEIVVVVNNTTDRTAEIARSFPGVTVIDIPDGGKSLALNEGDRAATVFPRLYVDADIELSPGAVRRVAAVLRRGDAKAAAPSMRLNLENRPFLVRSYYQIWRMLPYAQDQMIGCGVYAMSEKGRGRFGEFPTLLSEDEFVRLKFDKTERMEVGNATFHVETPTTLAGLIKLRTRWTRGNYQLHETHEGELNVERRSYKQALRDIARRPSAWPKFAVYAAIVVYAKLAARFQNRFRKRKAGEWTRDTSARDNVAKNRPAA